MRPLQGETGQALAGAVRVLFFQRQGFAFFLGDPLAAWRSFFALFLAAPAFALQLTERQLPPGLQAPDGYLVLVWGLTYVLLWVAFPVILLAIGGRQDFGPRVPRYIQVSNWVSVPAIYANLAVSLLLPPGGGQFLSLMVVTWMLVNQWWILREVLRIRPGQAVGLVFLAELINFLLFTWAVVRSGPAQLALQS